LVREIYVNRPLTSHKIMEILDKNPELEKITCPPSIYRRMASRYIEALSRLGVKVEPVQRRGRPKKYDEKCLKKLEYMFKQGYTPNEISDTLKIPLKTVYYFNKSSLKKGRKNKYTSKTINKVQTLHDKGLSAREISDNLNIPLRSVYDLLKRKS